MPISNLVECAVNLAEKVTGVDIDRDGDVGQRTSNESGAVTSSTVRSFVAVEETLPVFDAATPKVSILAIGKNTLDSANELLVEAGKQAAEFQPQATLKADFMLNNYAAGPGISNGLTTTDLTTGIADWKMEDGSPAPKTEPSPFWYKPTGEGKSWLGSSNNADGEQRVYTYTLSFEVTAPEVASLNLAFAVDDVFQSATLNGEPLTDFKVPTDGKLEGKIDACSALFKLGTNVLVVEVLNTGANAFGFYAEGSAITGTNATTCTFANATGARLEFFEDGSNGLLSDDYKPPLILEPGAVASFLVDKDSFALQYNIQVFQGPGAPAPVGGWMRPDGSPSVLLGLKNRSAKIEADVQVMGGGAPAMYPTQITFEVLEVLEGGPRDPNRPLVQIFAKQQITQTPRG